MKKMGIKPEGLEVEDIFMYEVETPKDVLTLFA